MLRMHKRTLNVATFLFLPSSLPGAGKLRRGTPLLPPTHPHICFLINYLLAFNNL